MVLFSCLKQIHNPFKFIDFEILKLTLVILLKTQPERPIGESAEVHTRNESTFFGKLEKKEYIGFLWAIAKSSSDKIPASKGKGKGFALTIVLSSVSPRYKAIVSFQNAELISFLFFPLRDESESMKISKAFED
ncbi:unnamed protein product [Moneuplotes crassus]|uniref:Uncharacterized protein n=1 Tax=Euplotes crassus TaxID=5936 RepID=A0AAD1XHP4_EUPCR|nr:unnamed protein product [Moneuplotes crassus]